MTNVIKEIKRDYEGTVNAYHHELLVGNHQRANELRKSCVGMQELLTRLQNK